MQNAIETIEGLRRILNDDRFTGSPFHQFRDGQRLSVTKRTLDGLLAYMRQSAKDLSFEGVFLEEAEAAARAAEIEMAEDEGPRSAESPQANEH